MSKNIWEVELRRKHLKKKFNIEEVISFFHQKFKEVFDKIERRSFKDKEYSDFRIIGDETFNEIKKKYIK